MSTTFHCECGSVHLSLGAAVSCPGCRVELTSEEWLVRRVTDGRAGILWEAPLVGYERVEEASEESEPELASEPLTYRPFSVL